MNRQESSSDFFEESRRHKGIDIDFKRILYRALKYWWVILLTLIVALSIAFLRNRYATRIYPVTASILIKEGREMSEGSLLYSNPLVTPYRNYYNQLYIIRSYPLIQSVVESLNFDVAFYREGNLLTTEAYSYIPVRAEVKNDGEEVSKKFNFKILDANTFELRPISESQDSQSVYNFDDTVVVHGLHFRFTLDKSKRYSSYIGESFILHYVPALLKAGDYVNRLNSSWAEEGSSIVNLSIRGPNPAKEIDFLNGLISRYQDYDLERKNQVATRTIEFISEQLSGISDSLNQSERQLEMFKNKNVVTNLEGEALRLYGRIQDLESQKSQLSIQENYYEYITDYINNTSTDANLGQIILPSFVGVEDPILNRLVSDMVDLQMEMKLLLRDGKPENPFVSGIRSRVSKIRQDIVEAINNQKGVDQIKLNFLNREIGLLERQLDYLPVAERQLISIQRRYSLLENLYVFLLQKRAEADISRASTTSDIQIVNPPMAGSAVSPKVAQNYTIAGFFGILLPLLAFVLLEVTNTRIQSREDIEKITAIPFIGGVGHKKTENNLEVLTRPKTSIAESFRALRSNLNYFLAGKEKAVFLITSSISGEGKTFTSINLASVLALSGKKTLIVGADMRKPKLYDDFKLSNVVGLSSYLSGLADFSSVVQRTSDEMLDLVSGGPIPPNPSELLISSAMDRFLQEAKQNYDYILIDTPPLAVVTDAFVLARHADHIVFVVRQNYTPKDLLKTIDDYYSSGRLNRISVLLNDIYKIGPGYGYGYHYGYGYGYGYDLKTSDNGYYADSK